MSKYRVVHKQKQGFYNIFTVEKREWFFFPFLLFWDSVRSFNTLEDAQQWIKNEMVEETRTVVHKE